MSSKPNDILIVIVLYRRKLEDSASFKTIVSPSGDIEHLFVYDNSPYIQHTELPVARYVHDISNGGLGKAYNIACEYAQAHGYGWLLLLDQDTTFPPNAMTFYRKAISSSIGVEMIAPMHIVANGRFLSPTPYRMKTSSLQETAPTGIVRFKDASPINSGILVSVDSFLQAGGYEEDVWLDFADICFIEKYRKRYPEYYVLPDVVCVQSFSGEETDQKIVFRRYLIYLECARHFPRHTPLDSVALFITTLRPTISRTIKERTLRYLKAYWAIYVVGHKAKDYS